jgi:hypothetical protein
MNIRNRIKEMRVVDPSEVMPNPKNWRTHPQAQRDALRGILAQVGIAAPVIAYETPQGLKLIDGHERMTIGVPFPAVILDVTDAEADILLATFDPITSLAEADSDMLDSLLREISTDSPAVAQMLDDLAKKSGLYNTDGTPDLDELDNEYGEYDETSFWPELKIKLAPDVLERWTAALKNVEGETDSEKVAALLDLLDGTV